MDKAPLKHFTYFCLSLRAISVLFQPIISQSQTLSNLIGLSAFAPKKAKAANIYPYCGFFNRVLPPSQRFTVWIDTQGFIVLNQN